MSPLSVIAVIAGYFILLLALSWWSGRGATDQTFFRGDRRTPWPIVAIAMLGAPISGVTFISVPGMVVTKGYAYLQMVLGFTVGYLVIAAILLPLFYRRNLTSIYGYLEERFGILTHRCGAWFFFVSKLLGAAVRFFVVCVVLQLLVFEPLGVPFFVNVIVSVALIGLYTSTGGVRTLIVTDMLKSLCLVGSVVLCIIFLAKAIGLDWGGMMDTLSDHSTTRVFYFDDPKSGLYFWKQFVAGVFLTIACTGLDQDLMQRNLSCSGTRQAQKNLISAALMQVVVISLFLVLGSLLVLYVESRPDMELPQVTDRLFGMVATDSVMPWVVGAVFVLGLISASYSAAGSALTSMTTSFTVDILRRDTTGADPTVTRTRKLVHLGMTAVMALVIVAFYYLIEQDAISAVYTLASYTYGPILGLFALGLFSSRRIDDRMVPVACVAAPLLCFGIRWWLQRQWDYELGFELLILNAILTILLAAIPLPARRPQTRPA